MSKYRVETDDGVYEVEVDDDEDKPLRSFEDSINLLKSTGDQSAAHRVGSGALGAVTGGMTGGPVGAGLGALLGIAMPNQNPGQYAQDAVSTLLGGKAVGALTKSGGALKKAAGAGLAGLLGLEGGQAAGELTRSALDQRMPNPAQMVNTDPMALGLSTLLPAGISGATQGRLAGAQGNLNEMGKQLLGKHPRVNEPRELIEPAQNIARQQVTLAAKKRVLSESKLQELGNKIEANNQEAARLQKAITDANSAAGTEKFTAKALIQEKLDDIAIQNADLQRNALVARKEAADAKKMGNRGGEMEAKENLFLAQLEQADNAEAVAKIEKAYNSTLVKLNEKARPIKDALERAQFDNAKQTRLMKLELAKAKENLSKTEFIDPTLRELYTDVDDAGKFINRLQKGTVDELRLLMKSMPNEMGKKAIKESLLDDFFSKGYDPKTQQQSHLESMWFPSQENPNSFKGKFVELYGPENAEKMEKILGRLKKSSSSSTVDMLAKKAMYFGPVGMLFAITPHKVGVAAAGGALMGLVKYNKFVDKLIADPKAYEAFLKATNSTTVPLAAGKLPESLLKYFQDSAIPMTPDQVKQIDRAAQETPPQENPQQQPQQSQGGPPSQQGAPPQGQPQPQ